MALMVCQCSPVSRATWGNREQLRQRFDPQANTMYDACTSIKPDDVLGNASIAVMAVQAPDRYIEPDPPVQEVTVADPAPSPLMHQGAGLPAGAAPSFACRTVGENDQQGAVFLFLDGVDNMAFPKRDRRHSIEHGGGLVD
jgi:hypothetical protein